MSPMSGFVPLCPYAPTYVPLLCPLLHPLCLPCIPLFLYVPFCLTPMSPLPSHVPFYVPKCYIPMFFLISLAMFPYIHHVFSCIYPYVSLCLHVLSFIAPYVPGLFSISLLMCLLYPLHIPSYVPLYPHFMSSFIVPMFLLCSHVLPNSFLCPFYFPSYVSSYMSPPVSPPMSYILIG